MRYLVTARVRPGRAASLLQAIVERSLGLGSVAGDEYLRNMASARTAFPGAADTARWVEVCFCETPLAEERPYWEEYFELLRVQDAHSRKRCRDLSGAEPWACVDCDCTARLEERLRSRGEPFLARLVARRDADAVSLLTGRAGCPQPASGRPALP
jgi:hypothetical protein